MFAHLAPRGVSINRRVINQIIIIIIIIIKSVIMTKLFNTRRRVLRWYIYKRLKANQRKMMNLYSECFLFFV